MQEKTEQEIAAMLLVFPTRPDTDYRMVLEKFKVAMADYQDGAICAVARRFSEGFDDRPLAQKQFAPSLAQFTQAVKAENPNWDGDVRITGDEQQMRNIRAMLADNRKYAPTERTLESKARVAAMVKQVKVMGSGVPNFNTGTIEERRAKSEKFNRDRRESKKRMARLLAERKQGRASQ